MIMTFTSIPKRMFWILILILLGSYGITIYAGVFDPTLYVSLLREDGPLENLATISTFIASVFFSLAYFRYKSDRPYLFLFFSLLLLLVFFEEISWGQRFFDIETPDTFSRFNAQNEINLHNYNPIYKYVNGVVYVCLDLYLIGVPLLLFIIKRFRCLLLRFKIPIPSPATAFLAFLNYLLFKYFFEGFLNHHGNLGQGEINYGEMFETGIELTLLFFAFECFSRGVTWIEGTGNVS
jgi:hypothetical protein